MCSTVQRLKTMEQYGIVLPFYCYIVTWKELDPVFGNVNSEVVLDFREELYF